MKFFQLLAAKKLDYHNSNKNSIARFESAAIRYVPVSELLWIKITFHVNFI